ncbi:MAG: hypothetical protein JW827_12705 [Spirochaetes bacterium]|nr:hypothetical protein [Spirochaetota bacterium]
MKKLLLIIFISLILFQCSNEYNPYSPASKEGFFQEQLLPYLGKKDQSLVVLVYLNCANDLESYGVYDFYVEMQGGDFLSPDKEITFLVLMDRIIGYSSYDDWAGTRLYEINRNGTRRLGNASINGVTLQSSGDSDELNMGDYKTLQDFIYYGMNHYPADQYILDIWNHGDGWKGPGGTDRTGLMKGVSWDEESANDYLHMDEVQQALQYNVNAFGRKIDCLYFDACVMQMIEVAYELKDVVKYLAASQASVPAYGGDYLDMIARFKDLANLTPLNLAIEIHNSYEYQYQSTADVTSSVVDTSYVDTLVNAINIFAQNLTNTNILAITNARKNVKGFYCPLGAEISFHADLYYFAQEMNAVTGSDNVRNAVLQIVKDNFYTTSPASKGISIYLPFPKDYVEAEYIGNPYNIDFIAGSQWRDFIQWYDNQ